MREQRGVEVQDAVTAHLSAGGGVAMLTATVPHATGDSLDRLLDVVAGGWRGLWATGTATRLKAEYGIVGQVRVVDATYGDHGWHPHVHALLFTERPLPPERLDDLAGALRARWTATVRAATARVWGIEPGDVPARRVPRHWGIDLRTADADCGDYLEHMTATSGKAGGRSPFDVLADFADTGDNADAALWREWVAATATRHQTQWTPNLRRRLGLAPAVAKPPTEPIEQPVVDVAPKLWRWLARHENAAHLAALLNAVAAAASTAPACWEALRRSGVDDVRLVTIDGSPCLVRGPP